MAYFDWNATAPMLPQARQAWLESSEQDWANPSTSYRLGSRARVVLEEAREAMGEMLHVGPEQVVFTSGATEANNGLLREVVRRAGPGREIWISAVEHPSVIEAARYFAGIENVRRIPVSKAGIVDLGWLKESLETHPPALVSVMAANNETGVIQPWEAILRLCQTTGVPFHCDAVQWFGKQPEADWSGCSAVTLSGHKFGGPRGVGCLVLGEEFKGVRIQCGGAQEMASRAGTENVPAVRAMVAALRARLALNLSKEQEAARDTFEEELEKHWPDEVVINGSGSHRLWNTCSVTLPQFRSERWIAQLDRLGFQVSSGSACSTGKSSPSAVLSAMGIEEDAIRRSIRISSGWETTPGDWSGLLEALLAAREKLSSEPPSTGPATVIQI